MDKISSNQSNISLNNFLTDYFMRMYKISELHLNPNYFINEIKKLNNNLKKIKHKHLIYYNMQLFVFNFNIDSIAFNIIRRFITSEDSIVFVDNIIIDELDISQALYLKSNTHIPYIMHRLRINKSKELVEFLKTPNENLEHLCLTDLPMKKITHNLNELRYLDLSRNRCLAKINIKSPLLKSITLDDTLINFNQLRQFPLLEEIHRFNMHNEDLYNVNNFIKINTLKILDIDQELNGPIDTTYISENLKKLSVKTEYDIKDNGSIETLVLEADTCSHIDCNNLTTLDITAKHVDFNNFIDCKILKNLIITYRKSYDKIQQNKLDLILNFSCLEYVWLSDVIIDPNFSFSKLINLKKLTLILSNNIVYTQSMFHGLTLLNSLSLTKGELRENIFKGLTNLKELHLSKINILPNNLPSLTSLSISFSNIKSIDERLFSKQTNLKFLTLYHLPNLITLPPLPDLFSLTNLDLSKNNFRTLKDISFANLFSLTTLDIRGYLDVISSSMFKHLYFLKNLYIDIYAEVFEEFVFEDLENLEYLKLKIMDSFNPTIIQDDTFSKLFKLRKLNIFGDILITEAILKPLDKLYELCLNHVSIENSKAFEHFNTLEYLYISCKKDISNDIKKFISKNNKNLLTFKYNNIFI